MNADAPDLLANRRPAVAFVHLRRRQPLERPAEALPDDQTQNDDRGRHGQKRRLVAQQQRQQVRIEIDEHYPHQSPGHIDAQHEDQVAQKTRAGAERHPVTGQHDEHGSHDRETARQTNPLHRTGPEAGLDQRERTVGRRRHPGPSPAEHRHDHTGRDEQARDDPAARASQTAQRCEDQVRDGRKNQDRGQQGPKKGEGLGVGQGSEQLSFRPGEREDREEGDDRHQDRSGDRRADLAGGLVDDLDHRAAAGLVLLEVPDDVFREDDAHIDHGADGDGDAAQAHQVRIDAEELHENETDHHRQRHGDADDEAASQVAQKHEHHEGGHEDLFEESILERIERLVDKHGSIIEGNDLDLAGGAVGERFRGQRGGDVADPLLDPVDHLERISPVSDGDHAADRLDSLLVQNAPSQSRPGGDPSHVLDVNGDVLGDADHGILEVGDALDETLSPHDVLDAVPLDRFGADVDVRPLDGHEHILQPHAVGPHRVGIHVDLVLADVTADAGDLTDTRNPLQGVAHVPVLDGAELIEAEAAPGTLECVPVDLAKAGGIRAETGGHAGGQHLLSDVELFQQTRPAPVEIVLVIEDHVDHGEAEHREGADRLEAGRTLQHGGERVGDLVFDVLRRTAGPVGEDELLVLADVRDGVDGDRIARDQLLFHLKGHDPIAPQQDEGENQEHNQLVLETETDDAVDQTAACGEFGLHLSGSPVRRARSDPRLHRTAASCRRNRGSAPCRQVKASRRPCR